LETVQDGLQKQDRLAAFLCHDGVIVGSVYGLDQFGRRVAHLGIMATRATWLNFMVGLPIAFFSGLSVAVSLLDDQTSSLVGVAISASRKRITRNIIVSLSSDDLACDMP
jgi:hypothetical protein